MLLNGKGRSLLIFCQRVADVTAIREIKAAIIPANGNEVPISKPITKLAPINLKP